ncbi:MAG: hypothetical protein IKY67_06200 [Paludibacteraceae bacterium]|nr:hypothetical protein [Paludibacteraceae bacterium]
MDTILTVSAVFVAVGTIFGTIFAVYKWFLKQQCQDLEIRLIKDEMAQQNLVMLACLDGLIQLGANGEVTKAKNNFEKYLNGLAHNTDKNPFCE